MSKTKSQGEKHRFTVELDDDTNDALNDLAARLGAATSVEVIRRAIRFTHGVHVEVTDHEADISVCRPGGSPRRAILLFL